MKKPPTSKGTTPFDREQGAEGRQWARKQLGNKKQECNGGRTAHQGIPRNEKKKEKNRTTYEKS